MADRERPWHLPVVGWLGLVWTAINAADYLLTQVGVAAWLDLFSEAQVAYFTDLPFLLDALWAVAVWAGLAGALCIVIRAPAAALLLGLAAPAMLLLTLGLVFLTRPPMEVVTGPVGVWVMVINTAAYAILWLYARMEHRAGDLP